MKKTLIVLALFLSGALLLTGGTTYAKWSSASAVTPGTLSAGSLDVAAAGAPVWKDVSSDRVSTVINPSTFRMAPGDTVTMTQRFNVAASGNRMKSQLLISVPGAASDVPVYGRYTVADASTSSTVPGMSNISLGTPSTASFNGAVSKGYIVTVTFDYSPSASNETSPRSALKLFSVSVKLNQIAG